jgi:hypothetical protein
MRKEPNKGLRKVVCEIPSFDGPEPNAEVIIRPELVRLEMVEHWLRRLSLPLPEGAPEEHASKLDYISPDDVSSFVEMRIGNGMRLIESLLSDPRVKAWNQNQDIESVKKAIDSAVEHFMEHFTDAVCDLWQERIAHAQNFSTYQPADKELVVWESEQMAEVKKMEVRRLYGIGEDARGGSRPRVEVTDGQRKAMVESYPDTLSLVRDLKTVKAQNQSDWRRRVKLAHPTFPDDLLDRLEDRDPYIRKSSAIALEHAARLCGIDTKGYSLSTLKRLYSQGRKLLTDTKSEHQRVQ